MSIIEKVHENVTAPRRIRVLASHLDPLLPSDVSILDVGCGDGRLAHLIADRRPDVRISGLDVLQRSDTKISVEIFDGIHIPYADRSIDVVLLIDVVHHCDDGERLLREAARVVRRAVLIKDHTKDGLLAGPTLRFMDRVGNARHGVALPYCYWTRSCWLETFERLHLTLDHWVTQIGLYSWPLDSLFGRSLHFIARLHPSRVEPCDS